MNICPTCYEKTDERLHRHFYLHAPGAYCHGWLLKAIPYGENIPITTKLIETIPIHSTIQLAVR